MRTTLRTMALAASAALAGVGWLAERPARAQNTYADFPYNQGSLFYSYRPYGSRSTATATPSNSGARRFFGRQRGYSYANPPQAYAPAYPTTVAPGYGPVYAPRAVVPTARYYYYPAR